MTPDPFRALAQHADTLRLLGVDCVPVRVRRPGAAVEPKAARVPPPRQPPRIPPPDKRRALEQLRALYEHDAPHRAFVTDFTNIVFGEGDPDARLMFIGEAPGEEEDKSGRPFVGRAGGLLDKMIRAMGLQREQVYIANVLKTRPPNNATPTTEEARACAPYLFKQIRIVSPEVIVTLGLPATRTLLDTNQTMASLRGSWHTFPPAGLAALDQGPPIPVMPTYHPAYVLRAYTEDNRRKVWSDLRQVCDRLGITPAV